MYQKFLRTSFPFLANDWKIILGVSIFIYLFMAFFQPFGMDEIYSPHLVYISYSLITLLVLLINFIILPKIFTNYFDTKNWNLGKHSLWSILTVFGIGIGNYILEVNIWNIEISIWEFLNSQFYTLAIGVFPLTFLTLLFYLIKLNKKETFLNRDNEIFTYNPENSDKEFKFNLEELSHVESERNNLHFYSCINGEITKTTVRGTIKSLESSLLTFKGLFKCHRSFIVNKNHISETLGNSRGMRLKMKCGKDVPVSRNHISEFANLE